jgi:UDP-xylose/UDP-N-acetylglucosamine transporter B4
VTLTLVVRKAVSLVISVLMYGGDGVRNMAMWAGAALVLAGTVGYSMGGKKQVVESLQGVSIGKKNREKGD